MESLHKLETMVTEWLKPLPHLPVSWRNWLANSSWWLTLIGVILSVLGIFAMIGAMLTAMAFVGNANTVYNALGVNAPLQTYTGWWVLSSVISLILMVLIVIVSAMAINPLKGHKKKGWDLLFLTVVIGFVESVVAAVLNFNVASIIVNLIFAVIGAGIGSYVLLEIRSYFK